MTGKQIEARMKAEQEKTRIIHETARKIRELLDAARKDYGAEDWDSDARDDTVLELVTEES
jgi:hypothetical protein